MSLMTVACATNSRYLAHCAAMLHSLLTHQLDRVDVRLFADDDVGSGPLDDLAAMVEGLGGTLRIHEFPPEVGELAVYSPPPTWVRVFLAEQLPELDRVLYLDSDLIVTDGLQDLWGVELASHAVAAVTAVLPGPDWGAVHCAALGLSSPDLYFNSGVLLMNLERLRAGDCGGRVRRFAEARATRGLLARSLAPGAVPEEVRDYARRHPERTLFCDQDALNAVLAPERLSVHPRWNCMNSVIAWPGSSEVFGERAVEEARSDPAIRHFEGFGADKPWHPGADPNAASLYWRHRSQTPWPEARPAAMSRL